MIDAKQKGVILILSGPSGAGKSSLYTALKESFPNHYFSISSTTRDMRDGEVCGIHYNFVTKEQFQKDIELGNFLEWAEVHGNYYGTSKAPILNALEQGKLVIFDIDVQGQVNVKKSFPNHTTSVFVTTKDSKILEDRLISRGDMDSEAIKKRLKNARCELDNISNFDYLLINDDFNTTASELICIVKSAFHKVSLYNLESFNKSWSKL